MTNKQMRDILSALDGIIKLAEDSPKGKYLKIYNKCRMIKLTLRKIKDNSKQITL